MSLHPPCDLQHTTVMILTNAIGKVTCNFFAMVPPAEHCGWRFERNLPCPDDMASPHTVASSVTSEHRDKGFNLVGNHLISKLEALRDMG